MKAMVLAAGLGTRLRPLTDDRPKALVEIGGRTLLEITLLRLRSFGVREVIVNAHHFADQIAEFLGRHDFGMRIEVSRETMLLDTGGGLKKAAPFLLEGGSGKPFLLHNVDVISNVDLARLLEFHRTRGALATLAVQERTSSRQLLFDEHGQLCGRRAPDLESQIVRPSSSAPRPLAFCGIHAISPRFLGRLTEGSVFSIIDTYLQLASEGEPILAYRSDGCYWRDLGRPEHLQAAERELAQGVFSL